MVEMVGGDAFYTASRHGHRRVSLEAGHAEEGDQRTGDILADTATIGIIHFQVVKRETLAFTHRDSGVTDVIGHPVGQHGYLLHFRFLAFDQLVYLFLGFRDRSKASVILVNLIEPKGFILPAGSTGHHELRGSVE